jgi:hypothetical protein
VSITVASPARDDTVRSPLLVTGRASVFEAAVEVELVADGKTLARGFTTASAGAPEWGSYAAQLNFAVPAQPVAGTVRVFARSAKDGSVQYLVEVPVRIQSQADGPAPGYRRLAVYFPKQADNDVTFLQVVRDVPSTAAVGRAALDELLRGPTAEEQALGMYSPIPPSTRLLSLRIENGVAYADFDKKLEAGAGGSVRVMAIRRSIELTLKQFSTVQQVVVSVEGKTEAVLQP